MKELKELVNILSKTRLKKIEVLQNLKQGRKASRYIDVFHKVLTEKNFDDEAASQYLYEVSPGSPFYFFKHRFRKLVLNSLFFMDFKKTGYADYAKAEYDCSMLRHQLYTLGAFDARNTAIDLTEDMLGIAEKYELAEYMAYGAMLLSRFYGMTGPKSLFEKYDKMFAEWNARHQAENNAKILLNRLNIAFAGSAAQKPEMAELAFNAAKEIEKDMALWPAWQLQYHWYRLMGTGFYIKAEYENSNLIWKELEEYLQKTPLFYSKARMGITMTEQMMNYLEMRDFKNGSACAARCLSYFKDGYINRLVFLEYYFLLCIQNGQFRDAVMVYNLASKDRNLQDMSKSSREKWILYHAWLHFLNLFNKNPIGEIEGDFNLYSFLNKFDYLNKGKEGFNVSLLITDICIRIHSGDKVVLMEKMASLKTYKKRYLKKANDYRVQAFIQLLLLCEELDYKYDSIVNKSSVLFNKLQSAPIKNTNNFEGMEVVPYDVAWRMVLDEIRKGKLTVAESEE